MSNNSNLSSVKSIAQKLGLSAGTISIVLNGHGDKMRISQATQQRILDYVKEINYQPNIYAKRLRKAQKSNNAPIIAVFWPTNFNANLVGRFFTGVHEFRDKDGREAEIMLQPYLYNEIFRLSDYLSSSYYNGIVFLGLSEIDFMYVTQRTFDIPIVLFNRVSDKYSAVCVDDFDNGMKAAELLYKRGHKKVAIISYSIASRSSALKRSGFLTAWLEYGMPIKAKYIIEGDVSYESGSRTAQELLYICADDLPTAVFIQESTTAVGTLPVFKANGVDIPRDMEILSYGDNPQDAYTIPSLTSIRMPVEEMSSECLRILLDSQSNGLKNKMISMHPVDFIFRESCGDFEGKFADITQC